MTDAEKIPDFSITMSIADAVRATGMGRSSIYFLIADKKIDARKSGKKLLIITKSLRAYIESLPPAQINFLSHR